jgi:hypothetical protein
MRASGLTVLADEEAGRAHNVRMAHDSNRPGPVQRNSSFSIVFQDFWGWRLLAIERTICLQEVPLLG